MLFSAGAKVPTPSVINGSPLCLEEFRDLLKGDKKTARTTFDRLDAHPLTGWGAGSEFWVRSDKGYRRKLLKTKCTRKWCAQGYDLRTILDDFAASLLRIELPAALKRLT